MNIGTSWEYTDVGIPEALNLYAALKKSNASVLEWYASKHSIRAINLKLNDTIGEMSVETNAAFKTSLCDRQPAQLGYSSQLLNLHLYYRRYTCDPLGLSVNCGPAAG